jgi:hypothetical protein
VMERLKFQQPAIHHGNSPKRSRNGHHKIRFAVPVSRASCIRFRSSQHFCTPISGAVRAKIPVRLYQFLDTFYISTIGTRGFDRGVTMICSCGETTNYTPITRNGQACFYRYCPKCGRELANGKAADLLNERFKWDRVGWYQDTLHPLTFLETRTRIYDLCLLRRPKDYVVLIESARRYLHGLNRADGNMIFIDEENR